MNSTVSELVIELVEMLSKCRKLDLGHCELREAISEVNLHPVMGDCRASAAFRLRSMTGGWLAMTKGGRLINHLQLVKQGAHLAGVADGFVIVAIVEQDMQFVGFF